MNYESDDACTIELIDVDLKHDLPSNISKKNNEIMWIIREANGA